MSEERLSEALESSFAKAQLTQQELSQLCFGREDFPPDLAMTVHRGVSRLWSLVERHHAFARRVLEPIPESVFDGVGAWERHKLLEAYRQYLLNGGNDEKAPPS